MADWSSTSLPLKLIKAGVRAVRPARVITFQLAEVAVIGPMVRAILTAKGGKLHPEDVKINRIIAMVRAKVEHPFRILKRQFGYVKNRYRGLAKNSAQLFTLFALGNLFLVRRRLLA